MESSRIMEAGLAALAAGALCLAVAGDVAARAGAPEAVGAAGADAAEPPRSTPEPKSARFLSKTYLIDRKYKSMMGPQSSQTVYLLRTASPELLWVTGFKAVMVGADGEAPISQEFMCHSNLDIDMNIHQRVFGLDRETPARMFTLSQGQQEIAFPEGFGIPVVSTEPFALATQVLNHNIENQSFEVKHKVTVQFLRDRDLKAPIKPLLQVSAQGLVLLEGRDGYFGIQEPAAPTQGPGCLPGETASTSGGIYTDGFGRRFTGHWQVKPGREVNRTNVTRFLNLPFDTTVHYIAVHLHPFAESLELRDLTAGVSVFSSRARAPEGRIGLEHVDYLSSAEGLPLLKSHEYEMVSVYDNTTAESQDSMAVMYMYVLDKEFRRPKL